MRAEQGLCLSLSVSLSDTHTWSLMLRMEEHEAAPAACGQPACSVFTGCAFFPLLLRPFLRGSLVTAWTAFPVTCFNLPLQVCGFERSAPCHGLRLRLTDLLRGLGSVAHWLGDPEKVT